MILDILGCIFWYNAKITVHLLHKGHHLYVWKGNIAVSVLSTSLPFYVNPEGSDKTCTANVLSVKIADVRQRFHSFFVDDHRQKYVEITKDYLWNELQNYCVKSTEKKISLSADWL